MNDDGILNNDIDFDNGCPYGEYAWCLLDDGAYLAAMSSYQQDGYVRARLPDPFVMADMTSYRVVDDAAVLDEERRLERLLSEAEAEARSLRSRLLSDTDYLLVLDYPIGDADRLAVMAYRQALRDMPEAEGWPLSPVWPEMPTCAKGSSTMYDVMDELTKEDAGNA